MKPATTDDVFDLMDSYVTSAALNAAMELGLPWLLAQQPGDVAGIAQALDIPVNRCQYWLQLLSSIGLVEQGSEGYVPTSGFDVVLECDAGPYTEAFFRKIRSALNPGGRLVIVDHFAPTEGVAPSSWLYWAFLASLENPDFTLLTVAQVRNRLEQAGFRFLSERTLPHENVLRWSDDWVMLEASR